MMKTGKRFLELVLFQRCGDSRGEILLLLSIMSHQFKVGSQAILEPSIQSWKPGNLRQ